MNNNGYPRSYINDGALYFVSNGNRNYYWAVEMGAYGSYGDYADAGGQVRCVRNLPNQKMVEEAGDNEPSIGKDAWAGPVYGALTYIGNGNDQNHVFAFGDRLIPSIFRSELQTGPYDSHNEMEDENQLPAAFVVSKDYIQSGRYNATYEGTQAQNPNNDPCRNYHENGGGGYDDYWRTPNLSELMVMTTQAEALKLTATTLCSTSFSNARLRKGFIYQYYGFGNSQTMITAGSATYIAGGSIRCVRDASPTEIEEAERNMLSLEESTGN